MEAHFSIGQIVHHRMFDYRGVVFDVDPVFSGSDEWYEEVARSRPPKDQPWYHVLVDGAMHTTYVAQRNLKEAEDLGPIAHPAISELFDGIEGGVYQPRLRLQ